MNEKKLLNLMNYVDEKYIQEANPFNHARKTKHHSSAKWLSLAACLIVVFVAALMFDSDTHPIIIDDPDFSHKLEFNGGDVGDLNILQMSYNDNSTPDFLIYVNHDKYVIVENLGIYQIVQTAASESDLCNIEISWHGDMEVAIAEETFTARDNEEVIVKDDYNGGVFVLKFSFDEETDESVKTEIREMLSTFEVIPTEGSVPEWMIELKATTMKLVPAILKEDLSSVADLLSDDSVVYGYGENVYGGATVANIYYTVDDDREPSSAVVSVRHRLAGKDSYDYISMELVYVVDGWKVKWAGIEA